MLNYEIEKMGYIVHKIFPMLEAMQSIFRNFMVQFEVVSTYLAVKKYFSLKIYQTKKGQCKNK